jgi:hypothetical protein
MIGHLLRGSLLALACTLSIPQTAAARTAYDGSWSVLIVTERGTCDRAYRYGVEIADGYVIYNGGAVNMSGRVSSNGQVRVSVTAGQSYADGTGRMSRNGVGHGRWNGSSGGSACSGYWEAERR